MTKEQARRDLDAAYYFATAGGRTWDDFVRDLANAKPSQDWSRVFRVLLIVAEDDGARFRSLGWRW